MISISSILDAVPSEALPDLIAGAVRRLSQHAAPVEFVSADVAAARTSLSVQTLRNLVALGRLVEGREYVRRGRRVLFDWAALVEWLRSARTEPAITDLGIQKRARNAPGSRRTASPATP
jgi:hypothetical protein